MSWNVKGYVAGAVPLVMGLSPLFLLCNGIGLADNCVGSVSLPQFLPHELSLRSLLHSVMAACQLWMDL